jgi:spermidine synthase
LKREPGSTVTVVYVNGLSHSQLPFGGVHTVLGALPALIHPAPARIAVIGLGSGDTTWAIGGREETQQIDSIEIIGPVLDSLREIAGRLPYPGLPHLLIDRRVRHHLSDGRAFLLKSAIRYDIIEADALFPGSAYAGNLYSVEYFTLLRSRLAPGGFAVTWAATPRVIDSLVAVFPHVLVAGDVAIGSESPIAFDPAVVRRRLDLPFTAAHYSAGHVNLVEELRMYVDRPPRIFDSQFDRRGLRDVNRDLFPGDEFRVKSID